MIDTSSFIVGKNPCPKCRRNGRDNAGNNLEWYGEGLGGYCFACEYTIPSDAHKEAMGWGDEEQEEEEEVVTREKITAEENEQIKGYTGVRGRGYRGIRDEINAFFGVRYEYDEETGEPIKQFVPTTIGYELAGYKTRVFPKDFTNPIGKVGKECDMIGEFRFKNNTRVCLIVGGEIKMLAAYQMLKDAQEAKGYDPPAVVCPSTGETSAVKQIQARYDFFNQFEKIIVCMDDDEAGQKANEQIARVLPKGKVHIMKMRYNDPDTYIKLDKEREFISDYWGAKPYVPAGIVGSGDLGYQLRKEVSTEKIPFPPFMKEMNEMTAGGISLGKIVNLTAGSGTGKTTWVDTMIYYWIFNSPHKIGVLSMELNAGQYGLSMLSRHIGKKISNIQSREEQQKFLEQDWVKEKERELFFNEDGSHRWHLVDDRDGSTEDIKSLIEEMIVRMDVKVIVIDVLSDVMDGLTNDEQALLMKWQKGMVKSHDVTFFNVNHTKKSAGGSTSASNGGRPDEEDIIGSSTIYKSASINIILQRDKMAEDEVTRNTTNAFMSKNRENGRTGPCGSFMYDNDSHQLVHKEEWLKKNPVDFDGQEEQQKSFKPKKQ